MWDNKIRCTQAFGFPIRFSHCRGTTSSHLCLSSVCLYIYIVLAEVQKSKTHFFSLCFKKCFIEIHFENWKGKSPDYANSLRWTLHRARSNWSSACRLLFPPTSFWRFELVPGSHSALVWFPYNLHIVFCSQLC